MSAPPLAGHSRHCWMPAPSLDPARRRDSGDPVGPDNQPLLRVARIVGPQRDPELVITPHAGVHREVQRQGRGSTRRDGRLPDDRCRRSAARLGDDPRNLLQAQRRIARIAQREDHPCRRVKPKMPEIYVTAIRDQARLPGRAGGAPGPPERGHPDGHDRQRSQCRPSPFSARRGPRRALLLPHDLLRH